MLGIDIGGTSVKAALCADGSAGPAELPGSSNWRMSRSGAYANATVEAIGRAVASVVGEVGAQAAQTLGVCVPGVLNPATNRLDAAVNLPRLVGIDLESLIRSVVPASRVILTTDAHAAAYDVFASRSLRGRLFALTIGTGAGACVLDDGVRLKVTGESSGHFGQIDVRLPEDGDAPPRGSDGAAGSLEAYVGARALESRLGRSPPGGWLLDETDPALRALARGIRIAHAIYRPDHVVLMGGVGLRLAPSLPTLRQLVERDLTSLARRGWTLSCGDDDFHGARGAARLGAARREIGARPCEA